MTTQKREWKESPIGQGAQESKAYTITVPSSWGTPPFTNIGVTIYQDPYGDNTNVSTGCLSGSASTSSGTITTPLITALTAGEYYRVDVVFTTSENNIENCFGHIEGER